MEERFWIRLLPWRRKDRADSKSAQIKFACQIGFNQENGWNYLELLLINRSSWAVWVEDANIHIDDLYSISQTSVPTEQAKIVIRQIVEPRNIVGVSLAAALYEAAGRPQRQYSCIVRTDVNYSVFDEWSSTNAEPRRATMRGLSAVGLRSI
jgi:hypothetical protein